MMRVIRVIVYLLVTACCPAGAAVVMTALPQPLAIYDDLSILLLPFDLDNNGSFDYTFTTSFQGTGLITPSANRVVTRLDPPPNIGGPAVPLEPGYLIGSTLSDVMLGNLLWSDADVSIVQVLSTGSGTAFSNGGQRASIGLDFQAADGLHYGFFDVEAGPGYAGITLYGWAYESKPNTPILAGSVPEPSRMVLLLTGALAMIYQRRRRQSEPH